MGAGLTWPCNYLKPGEPHPSSRLGLLEKHFLGRPVVATLGSLTLGGTVIWFTPARAGVLSVDKQYVLEIPRYQPTSTLTLCSPDTSPVSPPR